MVCCTTKGIEPKISFLYRGNDRGEENNGLYIYTADLYYIAGCVGIDVIYMSNSLICSNLKAEIGLSYELWEIKHGIDIYIEDLILTQKFIYYMNECILDNSLSEGFLLLDEEGHKMKRERIYLILARISEVSSNIVFASQKRDYALQVFNDIKTDVIRSALYGGIENIHFLSHIIVHDTNNYNYNVNRRYIKITYRFEKNIPCILEITRTNISTDMEGTKWICYFAAKQGIPMNKWKSSTGQNDITKELKKIGIRIEYI